MDIAEVAKGIKNVDRVIALHEFTTDFDLESVIVVTGVKTDGQVVHHRLYGPGNKPRVSSKYVDSLLLCHSCRNRCFADPEYFTQVIATSDAFLDYDANAQIPADARICYIPRKRYQEPEAEHADGHYGY